MLEKHLSNVVVDVGLRNHIMQYLKSAEGIALMHFRSMELTFCHPPNAIALAAIEIAIEDLKLKNPETFQNFNLDMSQILNLK